MIRRSGCSKTGLDLFPDAECIRIFLLLGYIASEGDAILWLPILFRIVFRFTCLGTELIPDITAETLGLDPVRSREYTSAFQAIIRVFPVPRRIIVQSLLRLSPQHTAAGNLVHLVHAQFFLIIAIHISASSNLVFLYIHTQLTVLLSVRNPRFFSRFFSSILPEIQPAVNDGPERKTIIISHQAGLFFVF